MRERAEKWTCQKCGGDGFTLNDAGEAVACGCRATRIRRAQTRGVSSVIPKRFRGVSFDRSPVPEIERVNPVIVGEVRRYIDNFDKRLEAGKGLLFAGDIGTGKTTLAMLISRAALKKGYSVAIYSVPRLLATIRQTFRPDSPSGEYLQLFDTLARVDLLHLDDLGAEKQTEWVIEQLYSLINERYQSNLPIIATTNLTFGSKLEEQIGERTVSRLVEVCGDPLPLCGEDQRIRFDPSRVAAS